MQHALLPSNSSSAYCPLGVVVIFAAYGAINTLSGDLNGYIRLYVMCIYGLCVGSSEDVPQFMFFYELISLVWY